MEKHTRKVACANCGTVVTPCFFSICQVILSRFTRATPQATESVNAHTQVARKKNVFYLWRKNDSGSSVTGAEPINATGVEDKHKIRSRLIALLLALGTPYLAIAELSATHAFNIPGQRADKALIAFAEQAQITFIFPFDAAKKSSANRLVGDYSTKEGITLLLADSQLKPVFDRQGGFAVVANTSEGATTMRRSTFFSRLLAGLAAGASVTAGAQTDKPPATARANVIEQVIVTAQRREETSQEVPMSIMTLDASNLEKMGFSSIDDIADKVPSLSIQPDFEKASALKVYIRGVGQEKPANFERDNGVGIYLDDIYVGHGNGLASELMDIERIEVLAGPQGILYGRNTIGGAVKFISAKPTGEFSFKQKLDAGKYGLLRSVSTINLDEAANVSSKFTLLKSQRDGWVKNPGKAGNFGERDALGFRGALRWLPTDDWTVDYSFDYVEQDSISNYQQHGYPKFATSLTNLGTYPTRQGTAWRGVDLNIRDDFRSLGHSLTAQWDINSSLTLKSITGYRNFDSDSLHDGTESYNVSTLVATDADQKQLSQEFLLSGELNDGGLLYHVGVYYFDEDVTQRETELVSNYGVALAINEALGAGNPIVPPALSDLKPWNTYDISNESVAVYGQITWTPNILDQRLTIDLGARYTEDDRSLAWNKPSNAGGDFAVDASDKVSSDSFDPAMTVNYAWGDNITTYFRYAQAYRSGGFDSGSERLQAFEPEELESYELGFKSQLLDDRLLLNMAVFTHDYTDIQVQFFDPGLDADRPPAKVTVNAAKASTDGAELEVKFIPVEGLMLAAGVAYLDSTTTVTNPYTGVTADRLLFNTPELKYNLVADYTFAPSAIGAWSARVTYDYRDEELAAGSSDPNDLKPDYGLLGARLTLSDIPIQSGAMSVAFWGRNLSDKEYEVYHNFGSVIYGEPRSYGVSLNLKF